MLIMAISGKMFSLLLPTFASLLLFYTALIAAETSNGNDGSTTAAAVITDNIDKAQRNSSNRYQIVTVNFSYVEVPYVICLWILLASVAKIGFHLYDKLPHIFPESCLLIVLGIIVGIILYYTETASIQQYTLDANIFFLFLLPPIVFDAGYNIPNRPLFNNMGTILVLAVINTLWNTFGIGVGLWSMSYLGWIDQKLGIFNCCVFGALISAVDPVAVLAIFEEIQINEILYIIVFGESLLNDGVTVVMYRMMIGFTALADTGLELVDYGAGLVQFFAVVIGGTLIGVIFGIIGVVITKYTDHVRIIEPLFIFVLGYLAYLTSEIIGLSSILALTFCGVIMKHYTETNMAKKSATTVKYFLKMMATISETIIFMFLGMSTVSDSHEFQLDFILFSIFFCLFFRITGVTILSFFVNRRRLIRLSPIDQFIMAYGGLRGGVAFCLAVAMDKSVVPEKELFVTTTAVIIFFTVFIQGTTIKPVVNALKVERAGEREPSMNEIIHKRFIDHLMAGVEDIIGKSGYNSFQHKFDYYNTKYVKPLLLREKPKTRDPAIIRTFTKLSVQDAKASVLFPPQEIPRNLSYGQLSSYGQHANNLFSRRATIAGPHSHHDRVTVINLNTSDPSFTNQSKDGFAAQAMLQNSMFKSRNLWSQERRHTLAEIRNSTAFNHSECSPFRRQNGGNHNPDISSEVNNYMCAGVSHSSNHPAVNEEKLRKVVSFSGPSNFPASDMTEIDGAQESSYHNEDSLVVFSLGVPVPRVVGTNKAAIKSSTMTPAPKSVSENSDPAVSKESIKSALPSQSSFPNTTIISVNNSNNTDISNYSPLVNNDIAPCTKFLDISPAVSEEGISGGDAHTLERQDCSEQDNYMSSKVETLAETSLPWRRETSLPSVPSSVTSSLPDDENPLMSEAPSWADNLAYSHLTETGSPYTSPQNTITCKPAVASHRPLFELFPPSSPVYLDNDVSSIPPPWSCKDNSAGTQEEEPLPSYSVAGSDVGGKASCLLLSSHDRAPPSYHSCLQPSINGLDVPTSKRHSDVDSPIHFQLMQKPEMVSAAAIESHLIGIEEDYHHGMADRVSQWLANSSNRDAHLNDINCESATKEEGQRILESIRHKKWIMEDTDDGTDGDVESDNEMYDTKL